jgi:Kef-type K+ transport system membrane component KefB
VKLLSHHDVTMMLLALAVLLTAARTLGELARSLRQPAIVGEILAGILLGPTVFGKIAPGWSAVLFPSTGPVAVALEGLKTLAITMFLLVAGMEVDLSTVWRNGATALKIGVLGMLVPGLIGFAGGWFVPQMMGAQPDADRLIFALFFAVALAISALPVIAKTLMDLDLYRTELGMLVVSAAVLDDLVGWIVFALVLSLMGGSGAGGIGLTVTLTLLFAAGMLTVGRWLVDHLLPYVGAHTNWPGGVLSFAMSLALFGAAFTEWVGVHAIFGAFLVGVAVGDSSHLSVRTRTTIDHFVSFIFAPLFFASIGLRLDFAAHFEAELVVTILGIACLGKFLGVMAGAGWAGLAPRDRWAVTFALNARGAMEVILGLLALQAGVIRPRLFVALVVMALATSIIGGPGIQLALGRHRSTGLAQTRPSAGHREPSEPDTEA